MPEIPSRLITYCTNIHPAETWQETFAALKRHVPAVKAAVSPTSPFPIGLRLSSTAAAELAEQGDQVFRAWLEEQDCFVPTINGFPFATFHNERVKEEVYLPDWRSRDRAHYTIQLADHLARWLPEGVTGSISTVPLGFKETLQYDPHHETQIGRRLELVLTHLARLYEEQGKEIVLALEPEPGCLLETTDDICRFFETVNFDDKLKRHLGICYDCCHQAVQFEDPVESLRRLAAVGAPLAKIQVSSALKVQGDPAALKRFHEPCYLHQVVARGADGSVSRYSDLPHALIAHGDTGGYEWRCHFHVPIFTEGSHEVASTRDFLTSFLPLAPRHVLLEVETYSWEVLPDELRPGSVTDSIIRELLWLKGELHA